MPIAGASPAGRIAASLLEQYERSEPAAEQWIARLCELASAPDRDLARAASECIFQHIVEPLADRFDPELCVRYTDFFTRVIEHCRRGPGGEALDQQLIRFGLRGRGDLLARARAVRTPKALDRSTAGRVKKAFVLSRVTLGADIAVTSVIVSKLKRAAPRAEIFLVGGPKSGGLFSADKRVRLLPMDYQRGGTLLERLSGWLELVKTITEQTAELAAGEFLIADPDSRFTQLGLLPVTADETDYFFFASRSYQAAGKESLGELAARWCEETFGADAEPLYPSVSLSDADRALGELLRGKTQAPAAAVNLGVGGNSVKRLGDEFEFGLLTMLLDRGYRVVLDSGAGAEELERTARLCARLKDTGRSVGPVAVAAAAPAPLEVVVWEGSLSAFGGLIAACDLYVGYDSAGAHLAAALGVPVVDIFAGAPCPRMRERWRPHGPKPSAVIAVEPDTSARDVLAQVREALP